MKILIKTWETSLVTLRSPDLGNWTEPCQAWENFSYAWSAWEEAETRAANLATSFDLSRAFVRLCNASGFNKAVLKLVENRKLLPHFLSRRARHGPNKKTILCPLGTVSRLMSRLIGCSWQYRPLIADHLAIVIPIILKEKNIFLFNLDFPRLVGGPSWPAEELGGEV